MRSETPEHSVQGQLAGHFGLRENAFGVTPDPRFLFLSQTHQEALTSLVNGIDCDFGFQVLVAQPGMGKTTLLFNFLERFRTTARTAFLFQPQPDPCELLQSVLLELGTNSEETSLGKLSEQLNQVLTRASRERRRVIVVLDEAQNLDFAVLEALRQLSNFETASTKLMQIVLAGQPQLAKRLALPEQEQLMQRISAFARLRPLALHETKAYIDHRLQTAGYQGAELFNPEAVREVWNHSRGVPRNINTLCFKAMLSGFAGGAKSIDQRIVEGAARDLDLNTVLADLYQTEPSVASSGGHSTVQPTRVANPPETAGAKAERTQLPTVVPGRISSDAGATSSTACIVDGNIAGTDQKSSVAPVVASAQIQPAIEAKRIAPPETSPVPPLPVAEARVRPLDIKTAAKEAPVKSVKASPASVSTPIPRSPAVALKANPTANPGKTLPPKTVKEPVRPEPVTAVRSATLPKKPVENKGSEGRIWWAKALALTAIAGILAFVLGAEFSSQRPGQVEANGSTGSISAQGQDDATPSDSAHVPVDISSVPPKPTRRNSSNGDYGDDVTVRKFSTDADGTPGGAGEGQKLEIICFAQDSAIIDSQYGPFLHRIAEFLAENPGASAILEGHTDDSGAESYNQNLSSRRAIAVRNALVDELHVSETRLTAVGAGATAPLQPNSSAAGRAYNRRVEVRLVHLGA